MRYLIYLSFFSYLLSFSLQAATVFTVDDSSKKQQDKILTITDAYELRVDIQGEFHADGKEVLRIYRYRNGKVYGKPKTYTYDAKNKLAQNGIAIKETQQVKVTFKSSVGKKRPHPIVVRVYQVPPLERLQAILTPLNEQIDAILSHGAREVSVNIEHNVNTFNSLQQYKKDLNKNKQHSKNVRKKVAHALNSLSASYKDASEIKQSIKSKNMQALKIIKQRSQKTLQELHNIKKKVRQIDGEINFIENNPINTGFNAESRQQLTLMAKTRIHQSLQAQQAGWQKFYDAQQDLYPLLERHIRKVVLLLDVLAIYADVYLQLSYAVELGQNINQALQVLDNATELEGALQSLDSNLAEINQIRQHLNDLQL